MAQEQKLRQKYEEVSVLVTKLYNQLHEFTARLAHQGEVMAVLVDILGQDRVQERMTELRQERKDKHEAELAASVQFMVESGIAEVSEVVTPDSFVVGDEVRQDGSSLRFQHEMKRLNQAGQARYLGHKAGDEVTPPGADTKVIIKEVYAINTAKVAALMLAKKEAAAAAGLAEATTPTT